MSEAETKLVPFIESKARLRYKLTNKNKTGFMDRTDYNKMVDTFISKFKMDSKTGAETRAWLVDAWEAYTDRSQQDQTTRENVSYITRNHSIYNTDCRENC